MMDSIVDTSNVDPNNQTIVSNNRLQIHKPTYHGGHITHGEGILACGAVLSTFVACLLCLTFCMTRRGGRKFRCCCCCCCPRLCRKSVNHNNNVTGNITRREFSNLNDWVFDMDGDEEQAGLVVVATPTTGISTNANTTPIINQGGGEHSKVSLVGDEWEEVTIDTIFPDLTKIASGRKKRSSLTESLLSTS